MDPAVQLEHPCDLQTVFTLRRCEGLRSTHLGGVGEGEDGDVRSELGDVPGGLPAHRVHDAGRQSNNQLKVITPIASHALGLERLAGLNYRRRHALAPRLADQLPRAPLVVLGQPGLRRCNGWDK